MRSTSSPNSSMRTAVFAYDGQISTTSPRTRKRERSKTASLRSYCSATSRRRRSCRSAGPPFARVMRISR